MQRKSRSTPAQLQIFENGARSAHAPEISELDPELELKFRSGPTTGWIYTILAVNVIKRQQACIKDK